MSGKYDSMLEGREIKSNPFLGTIGAIAGALIGAVLWVVLYQIGIIAALAGIAIITLACKGYGLLSGKLDVKGVMIAMLFAVIVLLTAHCLCWGYEIYSAFQAEYDITFLDAVISIPDVVFSDSELVVGFARDLMMGLVLILVGGVPYFKKTLHERKNTIESGRDF